MAEPMPNGTTDTEMKDELIEPSIGDLQSAVDTLAAESRGEPAQPTVEVPATNGQTPQEAMPKANEAASSLQATQSTQAGRAASTAPSATGKEKDTTPSARGSYPPPPSARPEKPAAHGSSTRLFLNQHITPHLLEGMKLVAIHEPENPLKWLGEFLIKRSHDTEATN